MTIGVFEEMCRERKRQFILEVVGRTLKLYFCVRFWTAPSGSGLLFAKNDQELSRSEGLLNARC